MLTTRFAPSPTGHLHLGHAASALIAAASGAAGRCLLRIEDIDASRCRPEYTQAIIDDLAWLGLAWSEPPRVQSHHMPEYRAALESLDRAGLLYPCFCTRAEIAGALGAPHAPEAAYPGTCRTLDPAIAADRQASGDRYALRLRVDDACARIGALRYFEEGAGWIAADPTRGGDIVLARKDTPCSYHLCATHDDALQGVTLVTRGADLRDATPVQVLLQRLLGWDTPAYAHHPLLTDAHGRRLAKRDRAATLRDLRAAGSTPADIGKMISCRIGNIPSLS